MKYGCMVLLLAYLSRDNRALPYQFSPCLDCQLAKDVYKRQVAGSVDEKLQTCDFKKKQYQKLLSQLNMEVQYI